MATTHSLALRRRASYLTCLHHGEPPSLDLLLQVMRPDAADRDRRPHRPSDHGEPPSLDLLLYSTLEQSGAAI